MVIPEPVTLITTSLGTTAVILGFLLTTASLLEQRHYQFKNIDKKIWNSLRVLRDIDFSFGIWVHTYTCAQEPFHEQYYEDHFGKKGWQDIKCRRDLVMENIEILRQELHLDTPDPPPAAPTSLENQSHHSFLESCQRVGKNIKHSVKKVLHPDKKDATSNSNIQSPSSSSEQASLQSLSTEESEKWKAFGCLDHFPELKEPSSSVGYKMIFILSDKWNQIDRAIGELYFAMKSLETATSAYRKHRKARQNKEYLEFEAGREKHDFSRFAKYMSAEIMSPQNKRPRIGWHLQVSAFKGREKSSESGADFQPQKMLNKIVENCHFLFATHVNIDAKFLARGLEVKGVRGNMRRSGAIWKTPADLWCDDNFRCLSGTNSEWFLRIEGLPDLKTFLLKTSKAQHIKIWTKDWQTLLAEAMTNDLTRKIFDVERARLVFGLTVWMILLWEEDWFSHICTCSLRCVLFGETEDSDTGWSGTGTSAPFLLPLEHVYSLDKLDYAQKICRMRSCTGPGILTSAEKKLQLFAILLAEILLVRKIATDENGRPSDRFSDDSEYELVESVDRDVDSPLAEGLKFCFERAGGHGMWNELPTSEQQKELAERVLKPAQKYYQILSNRDNKKWVDKLYSEIVTQQDESFKVA